MAPLIYKMTAVLPLFIIDVESFNQLVQERPEFHNPLLWIPSLDGPSQGFGNLSYLLSHSLMEDLPWLTIPVLLSATIMLSATIKEKFSLPYDTEPE